MYYNTDLSKKAAYSGKARTSFAEDVFVALAGGVCYPALEVIFRGYSHFSMAVCGAVCMSALYRLELFREKIHFAIRAVLGAVIITFVEFSCGCIVNRLLGLGVWDYSSRPLNIMGQICPLFSFLWFLICFPVFGLCRVIRRKIFHE